MKFNFRVAFECSYSGGFELQRERLNEKYKNFSSAELAEQARLDTLTDAALEKYLKSQFGLKAGDCLCIRDVQVEVEE